MNQQQEEEGKNITLDILVPETNSEDIKDIINAKQRDCVFRDEVLNFYFIIRFSNDSINIDSIIDTSEVQVTVSIAENYYNKSNATNFTETNGKKKVGADNAENSIFQSNQEILFSLIYNSDEQKPILNKEEGYCIFPLKVPLDMSGIKEKRKSPSIILSASLVQKTSEGFKNSDIANNEEYCNAEIVTSPNHLEELWDETLNFPNSSRPLRLYEYRRSSYTDSIYSRTIQRSIALKPMIEVYLHSASIDTDEGILSVEIQCHSSNTSIPIELKQLNVDITNAVVTRYTSNNSDEEFPVVLQPEDRLYLLYHTSLLEDNSKSSMVGMGQAIQNNFKNGLHSVLISIQGTPIIDGVHNQIINSKFYSSMNFIPGNISTGVGVEGIITQPGISTTQRALEKFNSDDQEKLKNEGITISFSVTSAATFYKIFTIQLFIVNRSNKTRNFTVVIPSKLDEQKKKTLYDNSKVASKEIGLAMKSEEFLRRWAENEKLESSLICLENNINLGALYPNTCQNINLHFIAIRGQIHTLKLVQLTDNESNMVMNIRNALQICVQE
ncbi:hypothetical protein BCR32DRAFT_279236 [Anaeromyces robustus]|uniref:Trafficking protein particle complex II-specific subunit 65 IgD3 domain-containing protein n=1 Tax=Anaeromyces robustus TaxID=1754192 RepID=A0A1Y1X8K0_9FUNG|nr:hypothetical protein BCR32DRAFT_279236 [Anaeromyces robustus]|eukprot:ORX82073.1 hypothetical protein BCR32DRAFT_279236 [Anaeromyces robustus]